MVRNKSRFMIYINFARKFIENMGKLPEISAIRSEVRKKNGNLKTQKKAPNKMMWKTLEKFLNC